MQRFASLFSCYPLIYLYWERKCTSAFVTNNPENRCICIQSRQDILKIHSRRMNLMRGIDLKKIAEKMNGASGAELKVRFTLIALRFGFLLLYSKLYWLKQCGRFTELLCYSELLLWFTYWNNACINYHLIFPLLPANLEYPCVHFV